LSALTSFSVSLPRAIQLVTHVASA
jgi:hypothetical protein